MRIVEIIGVVSTLTGIYLVTRGKIIAWPIQMLASSIYTGIFFRAHLFGEMLLHFIYALLAGYGWWSWAIGKKQTAQFTVNRLSKRQWIVLNSLGIICTLSLAQIQLHFLPTDLPYIDSFILVFCLLAQWMQATRKIENWPYWILLDLIAAGIYWYKDLRLSAMLYFILAIMALHGWKQWHHYHRASKLAS